MLNYNTTYHSSIGCEPSKVFHGRTPFNVLDHKLGNNPNKKFLANYRICRRSTKQDTSPHRSNQKIIMQAYLKYKDYYDRKAKAVPLKEKHYCFISQPKADTQSSKIPFREYQWIGRFIIQKVLTNDNYIVRQVNTNKTQILHRIRLKKFVHNTPLQNNYSREKLQPDEEIVIPQDDLYTISWEVDFDYDSFGARKDDWPDTATRLSNDATSGAVDYYVTEDERCSSDEDEKRSGEQANASDVNENQIKPRPTNSRDATSPLD